MYGSSGKKEKMKKSGFKNDDDFNQADSKSIDNRQKRNARNKKRTQDENA